MDSSTGSKTPSTRSFAPLLVGEKDHIEKTVRFKLTKFRQRLWDKREWKEACLAAFRDIKSIRWLATLVWLFALGWIGTLSWLLFLVSEAPRMSWDGTVSACHPDGGFDAYEEGFNLWAASGFFQITLAWGSFTFADAKIIDVAWDVIFGRGGQALLAWISWRVFADYTATSIQVSPITYESFWTIFLQEQPTLYSTYYLTRDFARSRGLQSRIIMFITIFVAIFILSFPTLGSAMTGYTPNNDAFVKGYDGTLIPYDDFKLVGYVIHDGWRVNLTGDYLLTYPSRNRFSKQDARALYRSSATCVLDESDTYSTRYRASYDSNATPNEKCWIHQNVSDYVKDFGFYGLNNEKTTWMNRTLPAPALNISAFWIPTFDSYGWNWTDPRTNTTPFDDENNVAYAARNETYMLSHIMANGSCQPMSDPQHGADSVRETYQWGFSFIQLYLLIALLLLWSILLAYVWLKARLTMRMRGRYDVPRGFKGVLELASAIRRELQESDPDELSHDQLLEEINKRLKGGNIELEKADAPGAYDFWRGFVGWCKDEKYWAGAVSLMIVPCIPLAIYEKSFGWWLMVPISSTAVALLIGRSYGSRLVLTLVSAIVGTIIFLGVWYSPVGY